MGMSIKAAALSLACSGIAASVTAAPLPGVAELQLDWGGLPRMTGHPPSHAFGDGMGMTMGAQGGSTHEIAFAPGPAGEVVVSGQNYGGLARIGSGDRIVYQRLPLGSGPHGLGYDAAGLLWVTLEFSGRVIAFAPDGRKVRDVDVRIACPGCPAALNPHPHGLAVGRDGRTVWTTGKATGTVARIGVDGTVATYQLPTIGSVPIYIRSGPDPIAPPGSTPRETMWVTELAGNAVAAVSVAAPGARGGAPQGDVVEYVIPTPNSRPIAVEEGPDGLMWFSEEAGGKVGRIERSGAISEFALPTPAGRLALLLAALAFDRDGNLWVQQYVGHGDRPAPGADRLVRISSRILAAAPGGLTATDFACFPVATADTVMHRIARAPDGTLWFTEMNANKVGRLDPKAAGQPC
jgi:virginiamycin B lyase